MAQQPISGSYVKVLYNFEDVFGFPPGGVISEEAAREITKVLGHGIRVDSWSRDNGLKPIIGLNSVEPSAIADGPFNGSFSLSFSMTGDITWMRAIMGQEVAVDTKTKRYTKNIAPPSMTFVVYMNNDSVDATIGDMWIITGVLISNVSISTAEDAPVSVQMDCVYKTEYKYDNVSNIPVINPPVDEVFNNSMVNAYFWNPNTDINGNSSFDSIECTIDKVNFSIRHAANLIRGIGTRVAKAKVHANIEYEMSMSAVFKDPKKFLERFYGCPVGPAKYIAPYSQVKIVIENFFRDSKHAKLSFAFRNVKIKTSGMPLAIENVIMEEMSLLPISCDIVAERGCPGTGTVHISPNTVEGGNELFFSGSNFLPGESITMTSSPTDLLGANGITVNANCLGELEYTMIVGTETALAGYYAIEVYSTTTIDSTTPYTNNINVVEAGSYAPILTMCKNVLLEDSDVVAEQGEVIFTGSNFNDNASVVGLELEQYWAGAWHVGTYGGAVTWDVELPAVTTGTVFTYTNVTPIETGTEGKFRIVATRGAAERAEALFYVPKVIASFTDAYTLNVSGRNFVPYSNVAISYAKSGETTVQLGIYAVDGSGYMPSLGHTQTYTRSTAFVSGGTVTFKVIGANGSNIDIVSAVVNI